MLAEFVAARPDDEPALEALHHGIVDGLAAIWDQDEERERMLERLRLAFRTPALHPGCVSSRPAGQPQSPRSSPTGSTSARRSGGPRHRRRRRRRRVGGRRGVAGAGRR